MSMKPIHLICPSNPTVCFDISPFQDIETLADAWRVFGDSKLSHGSSNIRAMIDTTLKFGIDVPLSTKISEIMDKSEGPKIVTFYDSNTSQLCTFSYRIDGLPSEKACGTILVWMNEGTSINNLLGYILLRHCLLHNISDSLRSDDYVVGVEKKYHLPKYLCQIVMEIALWELQEKVHRSLDWTLLKIESEVFSPRRFTIPAFLLNSNNIESIKSLLRDVWIDAIKVNKNIKLIEEYNEVPELLEDFYSKNVILKSRKCSSLADSNTEESTLRHYEIVASKITRSLEWIEYFNELKSRLSEFKSLHVLLLPSFGKTQLAFNLSHYYKVIYLSPKPTFKGPKHLFKAIMEAIECDKKESCTLLSDLKSAFDLHDPASVNTRTIIEPVSSSTSKLIALFIKFMEMSAGEDMTLSNLMKNDFQSCKDPNSLAGCTISEFKEKYGSAVKDYLIFIDDYEWKDGCISREKWLEQLEVYRYINYLSIVLGFRAVTTGVNPVDTDNYILTDDDLDSIERDFKWISILLEPFPHSIKYLEYSWEEDLLQSTLNRDIIGDPTLIQYLALFLLKQLSAPCKEYFHVVNNALAKAMEKLECEKSHSRAIIFDQFRDIILKEAIQCLTHRLGNKMISLKTLVNLHRQVKRNVYSSSGILDWKNLLQCSCQENNGIYCSRYVDIHVEFDDCKCSAGAARNIKGHHRPVIAAKRYRETLLKGCRNYIFPHPFTMDIWKDDIFVALSHIFAALKFCNTSPENIREELGGRDRIPASFIYHSIKCFSAFTFKSQSFEAFLSSFIIEYPLKKYDQYHAKNVIFPSELSEFLSDIRMPCLSPMNLEWDSLFEKLYPNTLGNFSKVDEEVYKFEYFEAEEKKIGCLQSLTANKISSDKLDKTLASMNSLGSQVNIIVCNVNSFNVDFLNVHCWKDELKEKISCFIEETRKQHYKTSFYSPETHDCYEKPLNYKDIEIVEKTIQHLNSIETVFDFFSSCGANLKSHFMSLVQKRCVASGNISYDKLWDDWRPQFKEASEDSSREDFDEWQSKWSDFNVYYLFVPILEGFTFYPLNYKPQNKKVVFILPIGKQWIQPK